MRHLAAAGGMADVNGVFQVEMRRQRREVVGIMIHVMANADLTGSAVAATVMGDDRANAKRPPRKVAMDKSHYSPKTGGYAFLAHQNRHFTQARFDLNQWDFFICLFAVRTPRRAKICRRVTDVHQHRWFRAGSKR